MEQAIASPRKLGRHSGCTRTTEAVYDELKTIVNTVITTATSSPETFKSIQISTLTNTGWDFASSMKCTVGEEQRRSV